MEDESERLEIGTLPRTVEELRLLQAGLPPLPDEPRPGRAEPRRSVRVPVQLVWQTSDGRRHVAPAETCNLTSMSVFLELDAAARLSSPEVFLELEPGQTVSLCAVTRVVRAETRAGKVGVALVIESCCFEALPLQADASRGAMEARPASASAD